VHHEPEVFSRDAREDAGVPVDISRTGIGRFGFEVWMPWRDAVKVWDALIAKGKA